MFRGCWYVSLPAWYRIGTFCCSMVAVNAWLLVVLVLVVEVSLIFWRWFPLGLFRICPCCGISSVQPLIPTHIGSCCMTTAFV
jgi:hypothetical protein